MSVSLRRVCAACAAALVLCLASAAATRADGAGTPGDPGSLTATLTNSGFEVTAETTLPGSARTTTRAGSQATSSPPLQWRVTLACGDVSSPDATIDITNCTLAMSVCGGSSVLFYVWSREGGRGGAWAFRGQRCSDQALPPGIPRIAVPSLGQIQTAFRRLPFSRPSVSVQPAGNLTLVNLPTFYRAVWPGDAGLKPGEISKPIQLLSWSIEFAISAQSYDFRFGDGMSSGAVTDAGGVYPDGAIRHTYATASPGIPVSVAARLTARYRVNGGAWTDLNAVADLGDGPVTILRVREAAARLVSS